MSKTTIDFKNLAQDIFLTGKIDFAKYGIEYRAGKTVEDVKHARAKALKNGMQKTEFEISMFEVYLKTVFKARKVAATQ